MSLDLAAERRALTDFAHNCITPMGVGYMGDDGPVLPERGCQLWLQGRFTHTFAVESILHPDDDNAQLNARWGLECLRDNFRDPDHDGWFSQIATTPGSDGRPVCQSPRKEAYAHAFVILAAASATMAKVEGARQLLDDALHVFDTYFWDEDARKSRESYDNCWGDCEAYRGINANMHTVEAFMAVYDATGDDTYLQRAADICSFVCRQAANNEWRIPEHYDKDWNVDNDYNRDVPAHPFRPWGATVGHGFEWARLIAQVAYHLSDDREFMNSAHRLYHRANSDGWDGAGFVYTTDFHGVPIVKERMHWVICEALNAANLLERMSDGRIDTGHISDGRAYHHDQEVWWDYVQRYVIEKPGRWIHELDEHNRPSSSTWAGKPDIYHAYQALYFPSSAGVYSFARCALFDSVSE